MNFFTILFVVIFIILIVGFSFQQSKIRKIHFGIALLLCIIITPIFAYFIIYNLPKRQQLICNNCGNTKSEKTICGVCGHKILDIENLV